jgi:hypothetical protein
MVVNSTINITAIKAIHSFSDMFNFVNVASGSIFLNLMMIAIFFILIVIQKQHGFAQGLTLSSAACFVLTLLFAAAGVMSPSLIFLFLILTMVGAFYISTEGKL